MPLHSLQLKVGAPIILMRNLNKVNGTRLVVRRVHHNVLEAVIITGNGIGDICLILRIKSSSSDSNQPFALRRRQFPVRLAFAMSINKGHGKTTQRIGPIPSLPLLYARPVLRGIVQMRLQEGDGNLFTCTHKRRRSRLALLHSKSSLDRVSTSAICVN